MFVGVAVQTLHGRTYVFDRQGIHVLVQGRDGVGFSLYSLGLAGYGSEFFYRSASRAPGMVAVQVAAEYEYAVFIQFVDVLRRESPLCHVVHVYFVFYARRRLLYSVYFFILIYRVENLQRH